MIASRNRFHGLNALRPLYKSGQTIRRQNFSLRYRLNPRRPAYRCAVIVSKKVDKSAVGRNRIRRRVFEVVRQLSTEINQPYDMAISIFSISVAELSASELQTQIRSMLAEAGIVDAKPQK